MEGGAESDHQYLGQLSDFNPFLPAVLIPLLIHFHPELTNSDQMGIAYVGAEFLNSKEWIIIWIIWWYQAQNSSLHIHAAYS